MLVEPLSLFWKLPVSRHYIPGSNSTEILRCLSSFLVLKKGWNIGAFSLVT